MVVNDVEHDPHSRAMAGVNELLEPGGSPIRDVRRVKTDAVIAPVARAGKRRNRHQFERRDTQFAQIRQPVDYTCERACGSKGSGMQFVSYEFLQPDPFQSRSVHTKESGSTIRDAS